MPYKFIEFPSGMVFFPSRVPHNKVFLTGNDGRKKPALAAGEARYSIRSEGGIGDFDFSGYSDTLKLGFDTLSCDWSERYSELGCSPRKMIYFGPSFKTVMYLVPLAPGTIVVTLTEEGGEVHPHNDDEVDILDLIAVLKQ